MQELQQLSFEFAYELTAELDAGSMCEFLQRHGLHGLSLWRRQCACSGSQPWGSLAAPVSMSAAACAQLLSSQQLPGPSEVSQRAPVVECRASDMHMRYTSRPNRHLGCLASTNLAQDASLFCAGCKPAN